MAECVEFWKHKNNIFVEYKSNSYSLKSFLKLPQSKMIIEAIYKKIVYNYPQELKKNKNKYTIAGNFIKKHFLKKDKIFDVIIHNCGYVVKFNLEE